jgi:hypothetical protein
MHPALGEHGETLGAIARLIPPRLRTTRSLVRQMIFHAIPTPPFAGLYTPRSLWRSMITRTIDAAASHELERRGSGADAAMSELQMLRHSWITESQWRHLIARGGLLGFIYIIGSTGRPHALEELGHWAENPEIPQPFREAARRALERASGSRSST